MMHKTTIPPPFAHSIHHVQLTSSTKARASHISHHFAIRFSLPATEEKDATRSSATLMGKPANSPLSGQKGGGERGIKVVVTQPQNRLKH